MTLTLKIWPWVKVMTSLGYWWHNCMKYQNPTKQVHALSYDPGKDYGYVMTLTLWEITLGQGHGTPLSEWDWLVNGHTLRSKINRIYHHTVEGTRESHPSVHDLQSTTRLAESWMLQIMDTRMGFPCPFHNVVIDYFSPTPFIFNK